MLKVTLWLLLLGCPAWGQMMTTGAGKVGTTPALTISCAGTASTSSTVACSGTYTGSAPASFASAVWQSPCSGSVTPPAATFTGGAWGPVNFPTPSGACTGALLVTTNIPTSATSGSVVVSGAYVGPGDIVSYTIWGGLRAYSAATRGTMAVNVCNVGDATCTNLFSDATTGALVITAIGGSNCASVTCTVKTLYDQTGGGHDMTNATPAKRPILKTSCIGSLPCMQFANAAPSFLTNGAISSMNQPYSFSEVFERTGDFGTTGVIISTQSSGAGADYFSGSANTLNATAGSNATVTAADSTWHTEHTVYDDVHTASAMCLDGTHNTAGISPGSSSTGLAIAIGTQPPATGTLGMTGNLVEAGAFAGTISGANCTALNSNEKTYWGF